MYNDFKLFDTENKNMKVNRIWPEIIAASWTFTFPKQLETRDQSSLMNPLLA